MIRVLHVVSTISIKSGVMNFIMNYYRNINKEKIQFDFLCWLDDDVTFAEEIENLGGKIYFIPRPGLSKAYRRNIITFFSENSIRYEFLHLHEVYLNMFIPPIARKFGIKKVIAHSHTTKYSDKRISAIRNKLLCLPLKRNVDFYFSCSEAAGKFLYGQKCVNEGKVITINNAIDCEKFQFNEKVRMNVRNNMNLINKFVIGHVGRFNNQKNHDFLIEIFLEVLKVRPDSLLMLIGSGPLKEDIKKKISINNITDKVLILDQRNDVNDLLQAMDVFVLPSLFEGLGIVLVEAQATGLHCVTSDVVPIEAKVTENFTYQSLSSSPVDWTKEVLGNSQGKKRENEVEKVRKAGFDIRIESKRLEEIYLDLI